MPRQKNASAPCYRHHKATVVTINGQQVYLGQFGTDQSDEWYRRALAELGNHPIVRLPAGSRRIGGQLNWLKPLWHRFAKSPVHWLANTPSSAHGTTAQ